MLPKSKKHYLDYIANILTIAVAIIFLGLFVQRYILPNTTNSPTPTVGNTVSVEGFVPTGKKKNVLLVLMKGCRFCEASVDFYKEVYAHTESQNISIIAVFPPGTESAVPYLSGLGLSEISVHYSVFADIEVVGTPTIIITDENGIVIRAWMGQLSKEKETEVLNFLAS